MASRQREGAALPDRGVWVAMRDNLHTADLPWPQRLAGAILLQAIHDARSESVSSAVRVGARIFLDGSPMLAYWCAVAGVRVEALCAAAARLERRHAIAAANREAAGLVSKPSPEAA